MEVWYFKALDVHENAIWPFQGHLILTNISIITQVIIEILALSLAENGVIFRYNHLREVIIAGAQIFKTAASRFVNVSEEEINLMKENAIRRNTKHATKFGMTLFKGKMWKLC